MISESIFDDNDNRQLAGLVFSVEMAVCNEWIVRDDADPDNLSLVYLKPAEDGTIHAACSCSEGSADRKCLHALAVINQIKDQPWLIRQLFTQPVDDEVAA